MVEGSILGKTSPQNFLDLFGIISTNCQHCWKVKNLLVSFCSFMLLLAVFKHN